MKKVLLVRLSALGDIINSSIVLQFIKQHYPDTQIEWVCEEVFAPLLQNHPLVSQVHTINLKQLKKEKKLSLLKANISKLQSLGEFEKIVDMQGLLKSAIVARIVGKNTHGFDKNSIRESVASFFYKTTTHIGYEQNIVKRNTKVVADALDFSVDDTMILNKQPIFQTTPYPFTQTKNIALVIGASWESKKYPKELFAQICGFMPEYNFHIIWGSQEEKKEAEFIAKEASNASLAPKLSLTQLVDFISSCDLTIGNDTGPTHLAWAQNRASITLFGPTNERMIYQTPKNIAINSPSSVDIFHINKNDFSIKEIQPQTVANKAKELLDGI